MTKVKVGILGATGIVGAILNAELLVFKGFIK